MDPAVVRYALERFGIDHFPMQTYIVNVLRLNSADSFLYCATEVNRKIFKELHAASKDTNVAQPNQPDCSMKTMAAISVITFSTKTLVDRGVPADNQLLTTLDPEAVTFFKTLHRCPANTEKTDLALTPLPSSMTVNSSGFSTWANTITKYLSQNLFKDKFTTMEYIIRPDKKHVAYGDLDPYLNFIECATVTARLGGDIYSLYQKKFYTALLTTCCDCGLSCMNIHWKYKDGRAAWASLTCSYYGYESCETAISSEIRKIDGTRFNGEGSGQ